MMDVKGRVSLRKRKLFKGGNYLQKYSIYYTRLSTSLVICHTTSNQFDKFMTSMGPGWLSYPLHLSTLKKVVTTGCARLPTLIHHWDQDSFSFSLSLFPPQLHSGSFDIFCPKMRFFLLEFGFDWSLKFIKYFWES